MRRRKDSNVGTRQRSSKAGFETKMSEENIGGGPSCESTDLALSTAASSPRRQLPPGPSCGRPAQAESPPDRGQVQLRARAQADAHAHGQAPFRGPCPRGRPGRRGGRAQETRCGGGARRDHHSFHGSGRGHPYRTGRRGRGHGHHGGGGCESGRGWSAGVAKGGTRGATGKKGGSWSTKKRVRCLRSSKGCQMHLDTHARALEVTTVPGSYMSGAVGTGHAHASLHVVVCIYGVARVAELNKGVAAVVFVERSGSKKSEKRAAAWMRTGATCVRACVATGGRRRRLGRAGAGRTAAARRVVGAKGQILTGCGWSGGCGAPGRRIE